MLTRINNAIAIRLTLAMSTIWCVYVFAIWSLLPVVFPGIQELVFYVSGGILQLVALPAIMVGQNLLNQRSEQRAEEDHTAIMETLGDLRKMMSEEDEIDQEEKAELLALQAIADRLTKIEQRLEEKVSVPMLTDMMTDMTPVIDQLARIEKQMKPPRKPRVVKKPTSRR